MNLSADQKEKTYIYRFRSENGEIMYIGTTTNPVQRIKQHSRDWWIFEPITVDLMEVQVGKRYRVETALIRRYRPTNNSFVAKHDNEYRDVMEHWKPWIRIFPDENRRFREIRAICEG